MGSGCSCPCPWMSPCCCPKKVDTSTQSLSSTSISTRSRSQSSKVFKSVGTSPIPKPLKSIGTSTIQKATKSIGTSPIPKSIETLPIPKSSEPKRISTKSGTQDFFDGGEIISIQINKIDLSSMDRIAQDANFASILDETILFDIDTNNPPSSNSKGHQKIPQNSHWDEKIFLHGELSDIVADIKSQTHGCINSSVSEDIDIDLFILHEINMKADAIFKDRSTKISSKEQKLINKLTAERGILEGFVLQKGHSYGNQYEEQYRRLVEAFIAKLEVEISKRLDQLQNELEDEKASVFGKSYETINSITKKADLARKDMHNRVQVAVEKKRKEIMDKIKEMSKDTLNHPLGYEQLRTLILKVYSTVGMKEDGQGCDNIPAPDRKKFIKDIHDAKPYQPAVKRTVYLQSDITRQQTNRNQNP